MWRTIVKCLFYGILNVDIYNLLELLIDMYNIDFNFETYNRRPSGECL